MTDPLRDEDVEDVRRLWGDALSPVAERHLDRGLPASVRSFLSTVGLPDGLLTFACHHDDRLLLPVPGFGRTFLPFATDGAGTSLVLEPGSAATACVEPGGGTPSFVNSSVALTVCFYGLVRERVDEVRAAGSGAERDGVADELRAAFAARDRAAVSGDRRWWPRLLDELGEGELV